MGELRSLAEAAGYEVVGTLQQVRRSHPRYHLGSGKAKELAEMAYKLRTEKIIFGNNLKVAQVYNLARLTGVEVIDRFQLILEIFLRRASTKEAKLQIDLARLRYEQAHAKEKVRLAKIGEQPGFLGLGKYEVDVYYESVRRQVHSTQHKLKRISKTRSLHRRHRRELGFPLASLAGYTNSGKSTLFNTLAEENVPTDPSLFTTLSTTTRMVNLFGEKVLLTDTVGFVDNLPLTLIEAFHSTLEETVFSDLVLLVVDVNEPKDEIERKLLCCIETIREIGATGIPIILVPSKIDLLSTRSLEPIMENLRNFLPTIVPVSALYRTNVHLLKEEMAVCLKRHVQSFISMPMNGESLSFLSWIFDHTDVLKVAHRQDYLSVTFGAIPDIADKIRGYVEKHGGTFKNEEAENMCFAAKP
jgi:GTP-binding protein HflX